MPVTSFRLFIFRLSLAATDRRIRPGSPPSAGPRRPRPRATRRTRRPCPAFRRGQRAAALCAAPGAKVTQIAELTSDKAEIVATDINENRLKKLENNISRLGIESIKKVFYDPEKILKESGLFDIILLDVPCSNTAVLAKRPEVRLKIKANIITKLKETQLQLLNTASRLIKPSGKICYCTCSLQKEENTQCVETFLSQSSGFKLELQLLTLPCADGFDHDGSYYAIISKP